MRKMHLFRLHYDEFVSEIGSFFLAFFSFCNNISDVWILAAKLL